MYNSLQHKGINLLENNTYLASASLASNNTSAAINVSDWTHFSLMLVWTGTPTGSFKLQCSNDMQAPTNWEDVTGSSFAVAGAAGQLVFNYDTAPFKWVRLVYTSTSGTGTITVAQYHAKGRT